MATFLGKFILRRNVFGQIIMRRCMCVSTLPYEKEGLNVDFKNGFPSVNVLLPSRDERCLFTLRPLTDTLGTFLNMVTEEDGGVERIAAYRKDGTKISKATTVDVLLSEDFDLVINSRKFSVTAPQMEFNKDDINGVAHAKDLIAQLYTQMNLSDWLANKDKELVKTIEKLKTELEPYEELRDELMEKSEKRSVRLTYLGLGLMGVQFGFLARLTWWEYSWDIMEPVTYFVTYGTTMAMFAYYVLTREEYVFPGVTDRQFLFHLHKLAKKKQFDVSHYNSVMQRLHDAQTDLEKIRQPIGLTLPESEIKAVLGDSNKKESL